jgi:hypothetical protein
MSKSLLFTQSSKLSNLTSRIMAKGSLFCFLATLTTPLSFGLSLGESTLHSAMNPFFGSCLNGVAPKLNRISAFFRTTAGKNVDEETSCF